MVERPPSICIDARELPGSRSAAAEVLAMRVTAELLGAEIHRTDLSTGPDGMHDFDAIRRDTTTVAVEVTTCIDEDVARFASAQDVHAIHEDVQGLACSWHVRLDESTRLDGLIARVVPLLRQLEAAGATGVAHSHLDGDEPYVRYEDRDASDVPTDVILECFDVGIDTAWAFSAPIGRQAVVFERRSHRGSGGTEHLVTQEVNRAAEAKAGVLGRDAARSRDARHLFVWLDPDFCAEGVEFAMWSGYPAEAPAPELPEAIDHVWVAMWSLTPEEGVGYVIVWEAPRGQGWRHGSVRAA